MNEIDKLLAEKELLENKKLSQIINFLGDGKLKDGDERLRDYFSKTENELLIKYADECLKEGFNDSGLALQDIVNEIGKRLGFVITNGFYRGKKSEIGFDGIWKEPDDWGIIVEVKTTDAYRISLDTIASYREKLIKNHDITEENSSILIVVGRNDTGELEAQIRGSKHAWDIRIISIDSLISLLRIKESLSKDATLKKISMALRPYEYTRVDKLFDLLFTAVKDVEVEENAGDFIEDDEDSLGESDKTKAEKKFRPVSFHEPVFQKTKEKLKLSFLKQTRSSYSSSDSLVGLVVSISKSYNPSNTQFDKKYWFALHSYQVEFLSKHSKGYISYACGSDKKIFLLPLDFLLPKLENMWQTKNEVRDYRHIVIYEKDDKYFLRTNTDKEKPYDNLDEYRI